MTIKRLRLITELYNISKPNVHTQCNKSEMHRKVESRNMETVERNHSLERRPQDCLFLQTN